MAVERNVSQSDIESVLSRLKGIVAVSAVLNADHSVAEIHVLASSTRSPKQVVRDVESAIMARLGLAIDHKKVSVAQVEDSPSRYDHSRLKFSDASFSLNESKTEATVRLAKEGVVFSGSASGVNSPSSQMKLVATATLKSVEDSGLSSSGITLEDASEVAVGGRRAALVMVSLNTDRGEELLLGSALIKQDVWKAVVNATLDAVNRRLTIMGN